MAFPFPAPTSNIYAMARFGGGLLTVPFAENLIYHIDAEKSAKTFSGANLLTISDLSGNGAVTTGTSGAEPTISADGKGIVFDGTAELQFTGVTTDRRNSSHFVVVRTNRTVGGRQTPLYQPLVGAASGNRFTITVENSEVRTFDSAFAVTGIHFGHSAEAYYSVKGPTQEVIGCAGESFTAPAEAAGTSVDGKIGRWDVTNLNGLNDAHIMAVLIYDRELTSLECDRVLDYLKAAYGVVDKNEPLCVIFAGDSITWGADATDRILYSTPAQFSRIGPKNPKVYNRGSSGYTWTTDTNATAVKLQMTRFANYPRRRIVAFYGRNDITTGRTSAQIIADIDTFITNIRTHQADAKVYGCTILPRTSESAGGLIIKDAVNDYIKNTADFDLVIDYAADSRLSDASDLTYFSADGVHLTDAGHGVCAEIAHAAFTAAGDFDVIPAENGNPLIPTMTDYTTSDVTMSSSSLLSTYDAWKASNGTTSGGAATYWLSAVESPTWLRVEFPEPKSVYEFELATSVSTRAPVDFILRGRNGAGAWTTLFSVTGASWVANTVQSFRTDDQGLYDTYELYVTADGGNGRTAIDQFQLFS